MLLGWGGKYTKGSCITAALKAVKFALKSDRLDFFFKRDNRLWASFSNAATSAVPLLSILNSQSLFLIQMLSDPKNQISVLCFLKMERIKESLVPTTITQPDWLWIWFMKTHFNCKINCSSLDLGFLDLSLHLIRSLKLFLARQQCYWRSLVLPKWHSNNRNKRNLIQLNSSDSFVHSFSFFSTQMFETSTNLHCRIRVLWLV